ncbi:hypothetical protein OH491_10725 [Termitidicoccus mucosus]|uniref:Uncharacterized protein n=1 Tax=Termitidicoccus mucosus TaxID=1184151 RepID=A0A178IEM2_9BACT|nr:hypothetical protein AW736_16630 [Opitutaceae bacterium TSB47]
MEHEIKESLILLLRGIKNTDGVAVAKEIARLDEFASRGRGRLHAQLEHFLAGRSYVKALRFLEERETGG